MTDHDNLPPDEVVAVLEVAIIQLAAGQQDVALANLIDLIDRLTNAER